MVSVPDDPSDIGVKPGDVLAGKYQVERVLGAGGMGVVVAAHHLQLDTKVALKLLLPDVVKNAEALSRFVREARAAVRIKSEHVARVSDVGELENGTPYMVMEYLEGQDLAARLEEQGVMAPEQAVEFVLQACEAIAEAHALGIVHRDLKPANLFCVRRADGLLSIKVLDFGISKVTTAGAPGHDMTRTSALMGSPLYMSPEQMTMAKGVDERTDLWSLGVILFELLTGQVPFDGEAVTELAVKIATAPPLGLRVVRPEVPVGLEQVVMRCLEKDRARRFQDVGELAVALEGFGPKRAKSTIERILRTVASRTSSGPLASSETATHAPASTAFRETVAWGKTSAVTKSRRTNALVGASVAAGLMMVSVGIVLLARRGADAQPSLGAATHPPAALASTSLTAPTSTPGASAAEPPAASTASPTGLSTTLPIVAEPGPTANRPAPARSVPRTPSALASASHPAAPQRVSATPAYDPLEHL